MVKMDINIIRDQAKNPSMIKIIKNGKTLTGLYDGNSLKLSGPPSLLPSVSEALRIGYPYEIEQISRPAWYDRNSLPAADGYSDTVGPHLPTERVSYTVPVDRRAMVELLYIQIIRMTAAAPHARVNAEWHLIPEGGAEVDLLVLNQLNNTAGNELHLALGSSFMIFQGDQLLGYTRDQSTNGTVRYELHYKITEFDA